MTELSDYPPGVQDLLKWAGYHLEQLDKLEREFRAWEALQEVQEQPCPEMLLQLGTPSRAEQARLRWHARAREACRQPVRSGRAARSGGMRAFGSHSTGRLLHSTPAPFNMAAPYSPSRASTGPHFAIGSASKRPIHPGFRTSQSDTEEWLAT